MKLHQLRYIHEVARQQLNVSNAAEALNTSQSGISKQIQLLEEELKLQIFHRSGKRLVGVTEPGAVILKLADRIMREVHNIKRVGEDYIQQESGTLTIAATHTQARYLLPAAVKVFMQRFPAVTLNIHQGDPNQVADQVIRGEADIGVATEAIDSFDKLRCLPCYQWNRCVIAVRGHPLLADTPLTLEKMAHYPLITYGVMLTGSSVVNRTFSHAGLTPNIVLTAIDEDVIKTYVNLGLGIGLLATMAYDPERDAHLGRLDASHLFPPSTTYIGIRRDAYLREYMIAFIKLLAPKLTLKTIKAQA